MEHELRARTTAACSRCWAGRSLLAEGDALLCLGAAELPGQTGAARSHHRDSRIAPRTERAARARSLLCDDARPEAVARRHRAACAPRARTSPTCATKAAFVEYSAYACTRRRQAPPSRADPPDAADGMGHRPPASRASAAPCWPTTPPCWPAPQGPGANHEDRPAAGHRARRAPAAGAVRRRRRRAPGDTDMPIVAGLRAHLRSSFARLSGRVPLLGIAAGRCFAGNAALLGCCDLIVATRASNIGMGGPAMIEGAQPGPLRAGRHRAGRRAVNQRRDRPAGR